MKVGPGAAIISSERPIEDGQAQARPCAQALVQGWR
jgi:hypothetical protein